jgi:hypothetical protein
VVYRRSDTSFAAAHLSAAVDRGGNFRDGGKFFVIAPPAFRQIHADTSDRRGIVFAQERMNMKKEGSPWHA